MLDWLFSRFSGMEMDKIRKKIWRHERTSGAEFGKIISGLTDGLIYTSETDSPIEPVSGGKIPKVTIENIFDNLTRDERDRQVEETDFNAFFEKLVRPREWDRPEDTNRRRRFAVLRDALKESLTDIHVYRIGNVRIDIFIVGIDREGRLAGIKTRAVET